MLASVRTSGLPAELVEEGVVEEVRVEGAARTYLAPRGFQERRFPDDDGKMRILNPFRAAG